MNISGEEPSRTNSGAGNGEVDRWIDEGLSVYAKAEPRAGIEGRVLARLAEARSESRRGAWSWGGWVLAGALGLIIVAVRWGVVDRRSLPPTSNVGPPIQKKDLSADGLRKSPDAIPVSHRLARKERARTWDTHRRESPQGEETPKMQQFPSAAPLNEQEEMLARYVREFPERATLMAQVQTDIRKDEEREMAAPPSSRLAGDSYKRE
ncbi:MAG TPA: hypothetical protein VMI10_13960 [Terriglobales bacterium]|nr:hypothetical protein [Terriglobales bacterium]